MQKKRILNSKWLPPPLYTSGQRPSTIFTLTGGSQGHTLPPLWCDGWRGWVRRGRLFKQTCSMFGSPLPPPSPLHRTFKIQFHKHSVNFTNIQLILNIAHLCISVNQGKPTREQSQNNTNIKKSLIVQLKGKMSPPSGSATFSIPIQILVPWHY